MSSHLNRKLASEVCLKCRNRSRRASLSDALSRSRSSGGSMYEYIDDLTVGLHHARSAAESMQTASFDRVGRMRDKTMKR